MLFFLLDFIFWQCWSLLTWSIQYLGPLILLVQLVRMIRADADLNLLMYEKFGMMPNSLRGQVVWITGASSGIGEHLAYVLAKSGCKLCLSARREKELDRVKQACLESCNWVQEKDIFVLPMDVLETEKLQELTEKVIEYFGHVDVLVNNAARAHFSFVKDTPLDNDRELIELVVIAQIALTKAVLPHFIQRQTGQFVVTNSLAGKMGSPAMATYSLGKHALMGYFEALRVEHARDNIAVLSVCPGPVESNIGDTLITAPGQKVDVAALKKHPPMTTERCAQLMAVAMANKLGEVWISKQPHLLAAYIAQYLPDCWRWVMKKSASKLLTEMSKIMQKEENKKEE